MDYKEAKTLLDNYFDGFDLSRSDALKISDFIDRLYEQAVKSESIISENNKNKSCNM